MKKNTMTYGEKFECIIKFYKDHNDYDTANNLNNLYKRYRDNHNTPLAKDYEEDIDFMINAIKNDELYLLL